MRVGIKCSPLGTVAYALYLAGGIVFLLLPWIAWQWLKHVGLTLRARLLPY